MKRPPRRIDNATVLEYAWSDTPFGVVPHDDGDGFDTIHGLAICQYEGSEKFYRFSCDSDWETEQDAEYESLEQAREELPEQYRNAPVIWHKVSDLDSKETLSDA